MIALKKANYLGQVDYFKQESGLIASMTSYPDTSHAENLHYHDTLHMSFILRGGNLEKRKRRDIERLPGTVTFYDAGEPHRSTHTLPGSCHINLEILEDFMIKNDLLSDAAMLEDKKRPDAQFLMLQVYKELQLGDEHTMMSIESLVLCLLHLSTQQDHRLKHSCWVKKVDELLYDRWNENISLSELALIADLHPASLSAYFTRYFGCTMGEYRRKIKIEKALSFMAKKSHSLTEIAYLCGFADQSHFIRTFKQCTGWTPKPYQQICLR